MDKFCKEILIYGLIITSIISFLLIGFGVLLILNLELVLLVIVWGFAGICILLGVVSILSLLIGTLRGLAG